MNRITALLVAVAILVGVVTFLASTSRHTTAQEAAPIFVTEIPPGYRAWKVVSVAHEEGDLKDIRAVLGNDVALNAYRVGQLPVPESSIVGRHAWTHAQAEDC